MVKNLIHHLNHFPEKFCEKKFYVYQRTSDALKTLGFLCTPELMKISVAEQVESTHPSLTK